MAKFDDENCLISNVPPKKFLQNIDIIKRLEKIYVKNICQEMSFLLNECHTN